MGPTIGWRKGGLTAGVWGGKGGGGWACVHSRTHDLLRVALAALPPSRDTLGWEMTSHLLRALHALLASAGEPQLEGQHLGLRHPECTLAGGLARLSVQLCYKQPPGAAYPLPPSKMKSPLPGVLIHDVM